MTHDRKAMDYNLLGPRSDLLGDLCSTASRHNGTTPALAENHRWRLDCPTRRCRQ